MKRAFWIFIMSVVMMAGVTHCDSWATETLELLGQTPGGSAFRTEFAHGRLYAGVGVSLWIYDATDPSVDSVLAAHPFRSLINDIVVREDSVVFVAANHDGLWALDASHLPDLPVLAHLETPGDTAAFDITLVPPDTIYLADDFVVRILRFTGNEFVELGRFADGNATGADRRGDRIAVCRRLGTRGVVELYRADLPPELMCSFYNDLLKTVEDVRFADLRDDIIYVCGGTSDGFGLTGDFFALQIEDDSLKEVAHYTINGNLLVAATAIITGLESRNDTLFLVTTAGVLDHSATIDCPVLDGTCLPDSLPVIGHICPGLLYFDVSLHEDLPALAIASEWFGIRWMDISGLASGQTFFDDSDTIAVHPTGGWGKRPKIGNDTLWLAWEGYGVGIFDLSDQSHPVQISSLPGPFATDFAFADTLAFVAKSSNDLEVYNLAPWYQGGEPEFLTRVNAGGLLDWVHCVDFLITDDGPRIAYQFGNDGFWLIDPRDCPNFTPVGPFLDGSKIREFMAFGDTLFLAYDKRIAALRISGDSAIVLADTSVSVLGKATAIGREGSLVAVSGKLSSKWVLFYNFTGDAFEFLGEWQGERPVEDISIKDGLVYVSLGTQGLVVLQNPSSPVEIAVYPGSGGRRGLAGTEKIDVGPDGRVYLGDFYAGCFILSPVGAPGPGCARGDVNGDGTVDVLDVVLAVNIILGRYDPDESEHCRADCVEDGAIDLLDLVCIVNIILGG